MYGKPQSKPNAMVPHDFNCKLLPHVCAGKPISFKSSKWKTAWNLKASIKDIPLWKKHPTNLIYKLGKPVKLVFHWWMLPCVA